MKKKLLTFFAMCLFLFSSLIINAQENSELIDQQLTLLLTEKVLFPEDIIDWKIMNTHISSTSGVLHVYYSQFLHGIEVFGTTSGIHILNNRLLAANNKFVSKASDKITATTPLISSIQAIKAAAIELELPITKEFSEIELTKGINQEALVSDGGISLRPIPVKLMYQPLENGKLRLVWNFSIQEIDQQNWWNLNIDATTGKIINKGNYTVQCVIEDVSNEIHSELNYNLNLFNIPDYERNIVSKEAGCSECYEVFALPIENPLYGDRTIEIQPANIEASPFGWHDTNGISGAEFTVTKGNNVNAFEDGDNQGYQPDGGSTLNFTGYPFNPIYTTTNQYEDASITNLFYMTNIVHDIIYLYGFDEVSGNFQQNNYGNGGTANDFLIANGQDGAGSCGANMSTPPEGVSPIMQMTICGDKDGDYENFIIIHEYSHGVTNRLTGGASNTSCLTNPEQMGEGWGDFFGIVLTIEPGDTGADPRDVGTYLYGQGIREYPYSTDFNIDPQTYDFIKTAPIPHGVGSVWATMLWEMTCELIDEYGFDPDVYNFTGDVTQDSGNVMALALVTEALKLQPCGPGFIDARDAIFAADLAIYNGENECLLWEAFAIRGLGFSASQGSSNSITDGIEAFDTPSTILNTAEEVCIGQGIQTLGGGSPAGGVYSGTGVTDDGNGLTYSFDPTAGGIGITTIIYTAASICGDPVATDTIEVTDDIPDIECQDVTLELNSNGEVTLLIEDVVTNLEPGGGSADNCGFSTSINLIQSLFTCEDLGSNSITVTITDTEGNSAICTPTITITDPLEVCNLGTDDFYYSNNIKLYPNPTNGQITLVNHSNIEIHALLITDIHGRIIEKLEIENPALKFSFSIAGLAQGMYFIRIDDENAGWMKRIIKQ